MSANYRIPAPHGASNRGERLVKRCMTALTALVLVWNSPAEARKPRSQQSGPQARQSQGSGTPGVFDYYVLTLSWAPEHCKEVISDTSAECSNRSNRSNRGFVLHGQ
jgi:ribonuclease T2